jgi:hypothetical protein
VKFVRPFVLVLVLGLVATSLGWAQSCDTLIPPPHWASPPPLSSNPPVAPPSQPPPFKCPPDPCLSTIGSTCADGTIYAGLSPDGNVPMYTTPCDDGQTLSGTCTGSRQYPTWNNGTNTYTVTGFTSTVTGRANTQGLAVLSNSSSPYLAAQYCNSLNTGGHNDWYRPAKDELNVMYTNRTAIGGFSSNWYWSSSEFASYSAWYQDFSSGSQADANEHAQIYVRCVRR